MGEIKLYIFARFQTNFGHFGGKHNHSVEVIEVTLVDLFLFHENL
jgi:hypothetical protein